MTERNYQPGEFYDYPLIIKKLLNTPLIYAPDQEIVYRDKMRYTYRDLNERIHRLANALEKKGIQPGDTVAVFDYDSNRFLEAFFAVPMMGAVLQMVNWRLSADQIIYTINHAEAKLIVINTDFLPILETIREKLDNVEAVVVIAEHGTIPETRVAIDAVYEEMLADALPEYAFPDLDENTKATTFYTTGTTGDPKGVHFTHRQLMLHTLSAAVALGAYETIGRFRSDDVYMPITPMFHVHAWGLPYVATLLGVKQVYPGKYEPEMLLKLIANEKVTFSHCVPTVLQMIATSPSAKACDLSRWKVIIGGSKLSRGQAKAAKSLGITVYTGYGMSETCPLISLSVPPKQMKDWDEDRMLDIVVKTGLPLPLVEFEVLDDDGKPLPHDGMSAGEVVFRTPWLTRSYFKALEKTKALWQNGWLHSGDVGHIDENGYLQITDRVKDVIKSGGEWVSSLDLENILSQHDAVLESAAIGIPDEKWGERPMMIVVLKPDFVDKVTPDDLKQHMKQAAQDGKLPKYGVPDRYEFVDEIAKTSVGKLDKKVMRRLYR
ncbi:fatty acid--CoA ligase [Desulfococcus multivorans]|uniref:AMP-dependent synthetase and ligase n=1 Tax=Desulfococcus multivorans DSM 2059 TaxID=1121405 RepID=S7VBN4_DESML|nr:fatty acid--CoA ligase [Desulfococcus multivorans]AOY56863.1 AMP-dependent synthetase and ligase [Desulfococcus multivorans]AQU99404.1 long-chain fatty acid--CoA ligase [Desulfococcus multivorans]EPR41878.1 AMP-dependent synthetase and ligase [Desulfococcus multivorans DSM 2059]SJZ93671.1 fatty-acyl-CoA synthase [Desulfococcus multivorans DSM 2059]